jgi:hypothetical protein
MPAFSAEQSGAAQGKATQRNAMHLPHHLLPVALKLSVASARRAQAFPRFTYSTTARASLPRAAFSSFPTAATFVLVTSSLYEPYLAVS